MFVGIGLLHLGELFPLVFSFTIFVPYLPAGIPSREMYEQDKRKDRDPIK